MNDAPAPRRILVYGVEVQGIQAPTQGLASAKYSLEFKGLKQASRFQEFDGVVVFQGSFESFELISDRFRSHLKHKCDRNELDKRTKEILSLIEQGGFICLLLTTSFIWEDGSRVFRDSDLSKRLLTHCSLTTRGFSNRRPYVRSKVEALSKFIEHYGAAWSALFPSGGAGRCKTLASVEEVPVSVVVDERVFIVPTLPPAPNKEAIEEYFTTLADGILSLWERLKTDLPAWATEYRFPEEPALLDEKARLADQISDVVERLSALDRLKRVLVLQGEPLVDAVVELFEKTLPLKPRRIEAFREDLVLLDSTGKDAALVEVKGVSRGVAREHINQADSHRERSGKAPEFPSLLIVNTFMKRSASIAEKDEPVTSEQIEHAVRNNILILRTLDLLNLASLHKSALLSSERVIELLTKSRGWLRVGRSAEVLAS